MTVKTNDLPTNNLNINEIVVVGTGIWVDPNACPRDYLVPEEAVETYKATPMWKNFNVQPLAGTGISISEEFRVKSEEFATAPGWYSLDGRRLDGKPAQSGIYVNGERKVVIK